MRTSLARPTAIRIASILSPRLSATVVCQPTPTPISARRWLSHWLLVSRFCPLVSSLPMEIISVFMRRALPFHSLHEKGTGLLTSRVLSSFRADSESFVGQPLYQGRVLRRSFLAFAAVLGDRITP